VRELAPSGYSGAINMMVGISSVENKVTGMRVLKHSETPGLGAHAVYEKFYSRFIGKNLVPLNVVKIPTGNANEIEAITAATITTRAITEAVNEAIEWYLQHNGETK
jgi:electron transport complex protein RnfG